MLPLLYVTILLAALLISVTLWALKLQNKVLVAKRIIEKIQAPHVVDDQALSDADTLDEIDALCNEALSVLK